MLWKTAGAVLIWGLLGMPGVAQEWAMKMFPTTSHDFGTVAQGAKAEFEFPLSNLYVEDVHIADVRSSCGCTIASIKTPSLKSHEKGAIVAAFNTRAFQGQRGATLTVTIDRPFYAQVQLNVRGFIRGDVLLTPGNVELGSVDQGAAAEKTIAVSYAGRSDWKIREVKCSNPHLTGRVTETHRANGQVMYNLAVQLDKSTPAGPLSDHLLLVTDEAYGAQIPVPVTGLVQSNLVVSPSTLFLGVVQPGQKVTRQIVVKGKTPFKITAITAEGKELAFDTSGEKEPKQLHLIPVTFVAGSDLGTVSKAIRIQTDLGPQAPVINANAVVTDPKRAVAGGAQ